MSFNALAAHAPKTALEPFSYEPEALGEHDVEIAISHCGICHSDVHLVDGEWGDFFPLVPGHEIVGTVVAGKAFPAGTRVGVGWQCNSCGDCSYCAAGEEVLCSENQATCQGNFGGFADRIRVDERFVFAIPDGLGSAEAAPLLCGGITVYSPLQRYFRKSSRVAVIGIGGLGHLALQFARAMGYQVTAVSRSPEKEAEARKHGAHEFLTGDPAPGSFDLVLNTAHAVLDMSTWMAALSPKGIFCQLGAAGEPLEVPVFSLIVGQRVVTGSAIGHPSVIRDMLAFAAEHGVQAQVEVMPMDQANEALDRTRRNQARYRVVLAR
jgi:alcohol/geraniol dehydrogenase (NADP+)